MTTASPSPDAGSLLQELVLRLRGLLGGDLLAVVAHRPSWVEDDHPPATLANVLVLVPDRSVHLARGLYQDELLRRHPSLSMPLEVVGWTSFFDNLALGDPATVLLARRGEVLYQAGGVLDDLTTRAGDGAAEVDAEPLRRFLEVKQATHFRNVPYLLARLLNEVYLGGMAAACRRLLAGRDRVAYETLERAAAWGTLPSLEDGRALSPGAAQRMERLAREIRRLIEAPFQGEVPEGLLGGEILRQARELAAELASPPPAARR